MDGARNPKIQSIYLDKFPIHQAAFAAGGTHVVASSRRRHFYTFDLASASVEKVCSGIAHSALSTTSLSMPAAEKTCEMGLPQCSIRDPFASCNPAHGAAPVHLHGIPLMCNV